MRNSGFGFRLQGLGFRVSSFRFRVQGFGFRVSASGCQFSSLGFRIQGFEFRVSGSGFSVSGFRFRVSGFRFRDSSFGFGCGVYERSSIDGATRALRSGAAPASETFTPNPQPPYSSNKFSSKQLQACLFPLARPRHRARNGSVELDQWLQRHPEAGSSWPSWPQASHPARAPQRRSSCK